MVFTDTTRRKQIDIISNPAGVGVNFVLSWTLSFYNRF